MVFFSRSPPPPKNEQQLFERAFILAGCSLGELAQNIQIPIPRDLKNNKGWVGILLERCLGAISSSKPEQDFPKLGIELKTIPIDSEGKPLETTFICMASLTGNIGITWNRSYIRHKLSRVLWIPVEGTRKIPLIYRRVGFPILWSPNATEEEMLRRDWEELVELIVFGYVQRLTASYGTVLQLRPKASNSKSLTKGIGEQGEPILTLPLGFYLKKNFTTLLLERYFLMSKCL